MKVGIIGAGPIGLGYAALLAERGHDPVVWSPRGSRVPAGADRMTVRTAGALVAEAEVRIVHDAAALTEAEVLVIAVLGNGLRAVIDAIAPHIRADQAVIFSSHASLGALYLSRLLASRGVAPTIIGWATTVTAGPMRDGVVEVRMLRNELDVAAMPVKDLPRALELCRTLFGDRFAPAEDLLAISLSNLNPPIHLANALLNFTRMENGEVWANYGCITPGVGRVAEALDAERLAVASAFGLRVRSVLEHFRKTFADLPEGASVSELAQAVENRRKGSSPGPATIRSRYLTEDLPFGIHPLIEIAKVARVPVPVHEAGLALHSVACGHAFRDDNDIIGALDLPSMDAATLHARCREGWPAARGAA
jgi:opine dehydrogenase